MDGSPSSVPKYQLKSRTRINPAFNGNLPAHFGHVGFCEIQTYPFAIFVFVESLVQTENFVFLLLAVKPDSVIGERKRLFPAGDFIFYDDDRIALRLLRLPIILIIHIHKVGFGLRPTFGAKQSSGPD